MARKKPTRRPNGESSIYQDESGKWHGRVTVGVKDNGEPDRRHVQGAEAAVRRKVRELENLRDAGRVRKPGRAWKLSQWLTHWLDNIITPSVRPKTAERYRTDVAEYLIPGLGAHHINKLTPEHIETLYTRLRERKPALAPSSIYHVHATLRTSLNEAVRRGHIGRNPAVTARPPQSVEPEIVPLTVEEAQRVLDVAGTQRNGVRFALALALGVRQGEAIGFKWDDFDETAGTLAIRRALQRGTWRHDCSDPRACAAKYHKTKPCPENCRAHTRACPPPCPPDCRGHARHCPQRQGGGLVEAEVKSSAGRRVVSVPGPLLDWLSRHRAEQAAERAGAGTAWEEGGWMFAQPNGRPIDPRRDYGAWRDLLDAANVRAARLHDARHTAATMLLVLRVPVRAAMDILGWSEASMASRYMHVPDEVKHDIAGQVAGLLWSTPTPTEDASEEERTELTDDQKAAVRLIAQALPPYWQRRIGGLLDDDDEGPSAVPA